MTLLSAEVRTLRVANKTLSKRRRAKKTRVCQGGALTIENTQDVLAQKEAEEQARRDKRSKGVVEVRGNPLGDDIVPAGRLVIIRVLVKIL
jgi:hypothetical protein